MASTMKIEASSGATKSTFFYDNENWRAPRSVPDKRVICMHGCRVTLLKNGDCPCGHECETAQEAENDM